MAGNQGLMATKINEALGPAFEKYGLRLDNFAVENISLPDELQKAIDTRISMGMMGDMNKYTQYQVANSIPLAAQNEGGLAGLSAGLGTGMAIGQTMAKTLGDALQPQAAAPAAPAGGAPAAVAPPVVAVPDSAEGKLEKLKSLLDKGLIGQNDYDSAKAEVLKALLG